MSEILDSPLFTLDGLRESSQIVWNSNICYRTPLINDAQQILRNSLPPYVNSLYLKMESAQNSGSFKIRGAVCQMKHIKDMQEKRTADDTGTNTAPLSMVAYSGGNYGKTFAMVTQEMQIPAHVIMPNTVPSSRIDVIQGYDATVELVDRADLLSILAERIEEGRIGSHPFDDPVLISGYASISFELVDALSNQEPDVILVPIGGGGLISGIAVTLRKLGWTKVKIFGVEPVTANVMYRCFQENKIVNLPSAKSVAVGTCSPEGGKYTYPLCRKYIDDVLLVNDDEIIDAMKLLYRSLQLVIEPTGAVALAALISGKLDDRVDEGSKINVLTIISGSNITLSEFIQYL